jgi:hypothetical protein
MASEHQTVQVNESILERLDAESSRLGMTRSELAMTLLEEGLRMQAHPGIVFRSGPAGRRPGLVCGMDIWEIASVIRAYADTSDTWVDQVTALTPTPATDVLVAYRYYMEYRDEIDEDIRRRAESSERRRAAWLKEQAQLQSQTS